jgi:hypothetical protein
MPAVETIMNVINAFASSIICAISAGPKFHFFLEAFNLKTAFGGGVKLRSPPTNSGS